MPRVLMIVGSLREQSFNRQLAREVDPYYRQSR